MTPMTTLRDAPEITSRRLLMGLILMVGVLLSSGCVSSGRSLTDASSGVLSGVNIDVHEAPG
jgi:hypothetical protein